MSSKNNNSITSGLGNLLRTSQMAKVVELALLFGIAILFIKALDIWKIENLLLTQIIIWVANIFMLLYVWLSIRLHGESWEQFGIIFKWSGWKNAWKVFLYALLVFVLAMLGFIFGSVLMANITGIPEPADMSAYQYLQNHPGMLLISLIGTYIVSSFGEEVIYRAFLINRIYELGLKGKRGKTIPVILSAIIFGLAHYSWGPMGIVQTGFMGLALGLCYIYMKRFWALVLAHALMDTILMMQIFFA